MQFELRPGVYSVEVMWSLNHLIIPVRTSENLLKRSWRGLVSLVEVRRKNYLDQALLEEQLDQLLEQRQQPAVVHRDAALQDRQEVADGLQTPVLLHEGTYCSVVHQHLSLPQSSVNLVSLEHACATAAPA